MQEVRALPPPPPGAFVFLSLFLTREAQRGREVTPLPLPRALTARGPCGVASRGVSEEAGGGEAAAFCLAPRGGDAAPAGGGGAVAAARRTKRLVGQPQIPRLRAEDAPCPPSPPPAEV